ncbi:3'-5' exoribonuclease YhaM [Lacicoccus qingdaonensis]|uniref:3'-5' exoribonuclease n=1 Tax=Lacicoccus qingdaonensis TaxID=576118 RepID=A0A1G9HLH4_9BACL|nr:3'-5' exoribonuclease YhaM [Salinicoccus qingdaonensis]SDL13373.1 3'-5' exoribonuclease [Salinicoccus qingdaonensis]
MSNIANLKAGDSVETFYLIKRSQQGVTQQGKPYMTLYLQDRSGEIEAKLWTVSKEDMQVLLPEALIKVKGDVIDYRNKRQMKIAMYRLATEQDGLNAKDFVEKAPIDEDTLFESIMDYTLKIENGAMQRIVRKMLAKYKTEFLTYPAAMTNHHDFVSGLAYHVHYMLRTAEALCDIYPSLNRSLLYSGIILHDIGKVKELSGPIGTTYTTEGNLIGHIVIAVEEISMIAAELEIEGEEVLLLKHLILSHHGKLEYGSPKVPMLKEAEILHFIDNIDARMMMMDKHLDNTDKGKFTDRIFPLENRNLYNPESF